MDESEIQDLIEEATADLVAEVTKMRAEMDAMREIVAKLNRARMMSLPAGQRYR